MRFTYLYSSCVLRVFIIYVYIYLTHVSVYLKSLSPRRSLPSNFYSFYHFFIFLFLSIARKKCVYKRILLPTNVMNTLFCLLFPFARAPATSPFASSTNQIFFSFFFSFSLFHSTIRPRRRRFLHTRARPFFFLRITNIHRHIYIYIFFAFIVI